MVVCLDAGHGGSDLGAGAFGRYEKDDTLRLTTAVAQLLHRQQVTTILTRTDDEYVSLQDRVKSANGIADLFVSIHRNSEGSGSAGGVEIWVYNSAENQEVADAMRVLNRLAAAGIQNNRGVHKGSYHVLRETKMPAMSVELGYISNPRDNKLFDDHFEDYAEAIARGICDVLGVGWSDSPQGGEARYQVRFGSFASREQAESLLKLLQAIGAQAEIVRRDTDGQ